MNTTNQQIRRAEKSLPCVERPLNLVRLAALGVLAESDGHRSGTARCGYGNRRPCTTTTTNDDVTVVDENPVEDFPP